jgi:hypothetical protein
MFATCRFTVCSLNCKRCATEALLRPSATSASTSRSRAVSASRFGVDDAGDQHLATGGAGRNSLRHVQGETRNRSVADIDLAGMHAGGKRELEFLCGVPERERASNRT